MTPVRSRMVDSTSSRSLAARTQAVPTAAIATAPSRFASSAIPAMTSIVRSRAAGATVPPLLEPLAHPGDLRSVRDRSPRAVVEALADVELHRVRPDIDHRVTRGPAAKQRGETDRVARVDVAPQTDRADGRDHGRRVLVLDRDRPDGLSVRGDVGDFRGAATGRVADASLVDRDRADRATGPRDLRKEAIEACGRVVGRGGRPGEAPWSRSPGRPAPAGRRPSPPAPSARDHPGSPRGASSRP